ncbi:MAG: ABC transporter permease, partial [Rhodospirillales bacterium]|nr:ABC transporter permease [Rhodospirillales bacterium]
MDQIRQTMGGQNWLGMWTLYSREVRRFIKVGGQTVIAPIITALMFLAVFAVAFGGGREIGGVPYVEFLAPGLIMMSILQNAFANTSSSLMMAKLNDNIIDTLMPPLSAGELTVGFAFGGVTRGVLVAGLAMAALMPLAGSRIHDPFYIIYYGVSAALMLS